MIIFSQALSDYSKVLLVSKDPGIKVLINRGLLYLQLKDYSNALLDFVDAGKVTITLWHLIATYIGKIIMMIVCRKSLMILLYFKFLATATTSKCSTCVLKSVN